MKLELGAGPFPQPGYDTLDGENWSGKYGEGHMIRPENRIICDVEVPGTWPISDNTYDEILSIHMFEHINRERLAHVFSECLRILKPGGTMRIHVPNGPVIAQSYLEIPDRRESLMICFYGLAGFHETHRSLFDFTMLAQSFYTAGFREIYDVTTQYEDRHDRGWEPLFGSRGRMSLKVTGTKP